MTDVITYYPKTKLIFTSNTLVDGKRTGTSQVFDRKGDSVLSISYLDGIVVAITTPGGKYLYESDGIKKLQASINCRRLTLHPNGVVDYADFRFIRNPIPGESPFINLIDEIWYYDNGQIKIVKYNAKYCRSLPDYEPDPAHIEFHKNGQIKSMYMGKKKIQLGCSENGVIYYDQWCR